MFCPALASILLVLGTAACQTSDTPHPSLTKAETEAGGDLEAASSPPPPLEQEVSGHFKLHLSYQPLYQPSHTLPGQAGYSRTTLPGLLGPGYSGQYVLSTEGSQARYINAQ